MPSFALLTRVQGVPALVALAISLGLVVAHDLAWAHVTAGPRLFADLVLTEDPFPTDELVFKSFNHQTREAREQEWEAEISKRITPNVSLGMGWEYLSLSPHDPAQRSESGVKNPALTVKYGMLQSPEHEAFATVGVTLEPGNVGRREVGAAFDPSVAPRFFFGKGLGDLPEALRYLKPLAVGGDLALEVPLTASTEGQETQSLFAGRFYVQYSLLYLQTMVKDLGLRWPFNRLFPVTEFSIRTAANGPTRGRTEATVHPGFLWAGRYVGLGVVADLPLTQEAEVRGGVSGAFHLFLHDLAPQVFRPLFSEEKG